MLDLLDFGLNLKALGIGWGTLVMFALLVGLLLTGMPLAMVTLLVALLFAVGWFGPMAVPLITSRVYSFVSSFVFISVPMFVLMAAILDRSGIARDLFDAMKLVGGRLRGGVAVQTIFVAVILAAMSGIIGGEIVLLGLVALPQMLRLGYDRRLAIGVVCAGGALGTMVPPSIVLIIYGLTQTSLSGTCSLRRSSRASCWRGFISPIFCSVRTPTPRSRLPRLKIGFRFQNICPCCAAWSCRWRWCSWSWARSMAASPR